MRGRFEHHPTRRRDRPSLGWLCSVIALNAVACAGTTTTESTDGSKAVPASTACVLGPDARDARRDGVTLDPEATPELRRIVVEHRAGIDSVALSCPEPPRAIDVELRGFTMLAAFSASVALEDGGALELPVTRRGRANHIVSVEDGLERVDLLEPFGATIDTSRAPRGASIHLSWIDAYRR